ncbi:tyrosine-type recombinase/integrase [Amycolatopsis sp. lyj-346]|uniref:tyrosine-type recombinase/integrase n=1 Tax=Amycolatopsis sp. lyj-346 TaxID=2789289 RepID=UPI00397D4B25
MVRRNANGEGSIYKRKDGRWEGAAYLGTISGNVKRLRVYGKTRKEAHEKLTTALAQAQQGISLPDRTWKLSEYLDYWLDRAVNAKLRPNTHRRYEGVVRLHLKPALGKKSLQQLSVRMVEDFYKNLLTEGASRNTVYQARKVLGAVLTHAMREELLLRNVARLAEMPRYKPNEGQYWTAQEVVSFLRVAQSDPLYEVFVLVVLYGLRRGEVLGIRWRDVDFEKGVLRIRQQIQRIGASLQEVELKTNSSERDQPLLTTAREALMRQRDKQAAARSAAGNEWVGPGTNDELVFTTRTGSPIEPRNLYRSFHRILEKDGIRRIKLHELRHTNGTTQKDLDVPERDIQAVLGHSNVSTTRIYQHVSLSNKRDALEKVENHLFTRQSTVYQRRSRQTLPSTKKKLHLNGEVLSGGASQTRTGDTRLFRPTQDTVRDRVTSINQAMRVHGRTWKLGCIAVNIAVKPSDLELAA